MHIFVKGANLKDLPLAHARFILSALEISNM
jgi:hypothetical protein